MSEVRFAKGPWALEPQEDGCAFEFRVNDADGYGLAVSLARDDDGEEAANAALIAAAPDLYEALEIAVRELRLVRDGSLHGTPNSVFALIPEAIEKADAALSRARGE